MTHKLSTSTMCDKVATASPHVVITYLENLEHIYRENIAMSWVVKKLLPGQEDLIVVYRCAGSMGTYSSRHLQKLNTLETSSGLWMLRQVASRHLPERNQCKQPSSLVLNQPAKFKQLDLCWTYWSATNTLHQFSLNFSQTATYSSA